MRRQAPALFAAICLSAVVVGVLAAQEPQPDGKAVPAPVPAKHKWPECGTGPLQQVKDLAWMAGTWDVTVKWFPPPEYKAPPWTQTTESVIEPMLNATFLREKISVPFGKMITTMEGVRSFDRFRGTYRLVFFDDVTTLADVFEGTPQDGVLPLTNVRCGTSFMSQETGEQFMRLTQSPVTAGPEPVGAFTLKWEVSRDKGQTWRQTCEFSYKRKP